MPRKNLSKTETIKDRTVYIYMPTFKMLEDWKNRSKASNTSLSKFVIDRVEDSIRKDEGEGGYLSRLELVKRLRKAEDGLKEVTKENGILKRLVENQEIELKRYRAEPFISRDFDGILQHDQDLIELLKGGQSYSADEILSRLNIDRSNVDLVKAINNQLEFLETHGLVVYSGRGWKWKK
jgi:hypothetical protein